MGIINLTPDSFYDGGRYTGVRSVLQDAEEKVRQGAQILDLGASSTRPGAPEIPAEEEWERLGPSLREIRKAFPDILLSVDTYRAEIANRAAAEGIDMINDVSGGQSDPGMFDTVARLDLPYILMHMKGNPRNMQTNPVYDDVVQEVLDFFRLGIQQLQNKGFQRIMLDPGFGFGKTLEHNYRLLNQFHRFCELGFPVVAGLSRKSMINKVIGTNPVTALNGTSVLNTIAVMNGAGILRVHDVREAKQVIELVAYYRNL
ncbi:MAG TPA: dihydropteroate synthase [Bacteroidia bacterium]|nr:dihydropteroate synthase [Bacteroidia bacterium]